MGVPDTGVPDVGVQDVGAPNSGVPNVTVPEVGVPNLHVPNVGVPNVGVPNVAVPNIHVPNVTVPNVEVPKVDAPGFGAPNIRARDLDMPALPHTPGRPRPRIPRLSPLPGPLSEEQLRPPPKLLRRRIPLLPSPTAGRRPTTVTGAAVGTRTAARPTAGDRCA